MKNRGDIFGREVGERGGWKKNLKCVGMEEGELKRIGRFLQ